ncbi:MAG: transglutaminase [Myxococcales bacterium]|nr:transglutaminase [Myxococcales bacterium]
MKRATPWVIATLLVLPALALALKVVVLGYRLSDILPRTVYRVTLTMRLDGHGRDVKVRTYLPASDDRQTITNEEQSAKELRLGFESDGGNRLAVWTGGGVGDGAEARFSYTVMTEPVRYQLDAGLEVPTAYAESIARYLRPDTAIQVDSPEITELAHRLGADRGDVRARLDRIYGFVSAMPQRPFKGTTDALTALRLGEASCNGKSRLVVALARNVGIPARLVGGLILHRGSKRTSHQWVEVYVGGRWVPICPTNHHFAELPASYLVLYRGDQALFRHTADVNFDYRFGITSERVPSPKAKAAFKVWNVWALFDRLQLPFSLLRTILMLPIGALVVVVFRNVIGMPTFGTFLPALIAASAGETGAGWGVIAVLILVAVVFLARWAVHRLELLHSPTLAILLAAVAVTILSTALVADHLGLPRLTRITMFPLAVMAITAERFYLGMTEQGVRTAVKELLGTLVVMLACFAVMSSLALQVLLIGFPEVLLWVVAANIYLGRWVGLRLSEYLRFRAVLTPGAM